MPQFDISTFPSQIFWLIICFSILCFAMVTFLAPRLGSSLENRQRVLSDLTKAAELADSKATELATKNQLTLKEAQNEVHDLIQTTLSQANALKNDQIANFEQSVQNTLKELNDRIHTEKNDILRDAESLVIHLASCAYQKLTGLSLDETLIASTPPITSMKPTKITQRQTKNDKGDLS